MKILLDKPLTKKSLDETTISRWVNPKGFKLPMFSIINPLFGSALNVSFGKYKEFRRFLIEIYEVELDHDEPMAIFVYFKNRKDDGRMTYFINIQENQWRSVDYGTISHELHHYVHYSLNQLGITHSKESEEVFAYSHGYFMERMCRGFVEYRKKFK